MLNSSQKRTKQNTSKQLLSKGQKSKKHTSKQLLSKGQKSKKKSKGQISKKKSKGKKQTKKSLKGGDLEDIDIKDQLGTPTVVYKGDVLEIGTVIKNTCYQLNNGDWKIKNSDDLHQAISQLKVEGYSFDELMLKFLKDINDSKKEKMRKICKDVLKMIEEEENTNIEPKDVIIREGLRDYFSDIKDQLDTPAAD